MRLPSSVQGRLLLLVLVAALPFLAISGYIARQNYVQVVGEADRNALVAEAGVRVRYGALLDDGERALSLLSRSVDIAPANAAHCDEQLGSVQGLLADRIAGIALFGADGRVLCSAHGPIGRDQAGRDQGGRDQAWALAKLRPDRDSRDLAGFSVADISVDGDPGGAVLRAMLPLDRDGRRVGVLVAGLDLAWLMRGSGPGASGGTDRHVWLLDESGSVVASSDTSDAAAPAPLTFAKAAASMAPTIGAARSGEQVDYIVAPPFAKLRLVVATSAAASLARADAVLADRLVAMLIGLIAALLLLMAGTRLAIVEPLNRLTASVKAWRGGGAFEPAGRAGPVEVDELAHLFGTALAAVAEHERQLRGATNNQELLMQEIHHRVKNNLQIIASLLNLQASRIRVPEARAEFQSARDRIRALATLHRHLYAYGELHTINMRLFLMELCGQLLQALTSPGRIQLDIEAIELQISSDQAVPMALIVTEAVSNAAKYAFPGERQGTIHIRLTREAELVRLVVEDDGIGIPAGRAETEAGVRDGIGLQLIRGFARQLGATLTVVEEGGTRYDMAMPIKREPAAPTGADGAV